MALFSRIFAKATGYDAANGVGNGDRASIQTERKNEDGILPARKRAALIAVQRDEFRNTTFSPATALQLQINVIGNEGGKLTFTTDDENFNAEAGRSFRRWAKRCNFTDGSSLNETLQLLLIQLTHNGGDFIAVFDDGCLTGGKGSGKIRIFESDEIKNVKEDLFRSIYGDKFTQSNGIVYDQYGRVVAAFVSTLAREKEEFSKGEFIHLKLKSPADFSDSNWIHVANRWRVNQGRGVSTATHVTNLLQDLAETQSAEVNAAKLNAGMGLVISDVNNEDAAQADISRGWGDSDANGDYGEMSADEQAEIEAAEAAENAALRTASSNLCAGKAAIVKLAGGKKLDSFKTERPNLNTVEFIKNQRNEAGTVYGLPSCYTTLEPAGSYTAFRGAMVMAERAFARLRKKMERDYLDWVAVRFIEWSGIAYPDGYDDDLLWRWPSMAEVDEGAAQTAIEKSLANGTESLTSILGPEKVVKIADQQAAEKEIFESRGLVYPASRTANGSIIQSNGEVSE